MTDLLAEGDTLPLELDADQLRIVLDGLAELAGHDRTDLVSVEVLDSWIRYQAARHRRGDHDPIPPESPTYLGSTTHGPRHHRHATR